MASSTCAALSSVDKLFIGLDWLRSFMKRNANLTIQQPENCSLSCCTSFNEYTMNTCFDNLSVALNPYEHFGDGTRIWNLDETRTSTVVNKPVKMFPVAAAVDSWHKCNPGKVFSIYHIAGCVNVAHQKAMTPTTIINGFKKTGIYPFNRHIFSKEDFLSSSVTDQPLPEKTMHEPLKHVLTAVHNSPLKNERTENEENQKCLNSPADFKGYPKGSTDLFVVLEVLRSPSLGMDQPTRIKT
ncbi:hypothetical protein J437_LFUL011323 [Ladona fulva]|uniref:Uncharacterized protein n=1 Tax=Ladona fulva TaxID=123851 RepID=A0A8K0KBL0_LADFU|nr:hypothetical protein J437_LFUL011323 [Ladona fulva]